MNPQVQSFIRVELLSGLNQLPETWQLVFKRMYSHDDLSRSMQDVVSLIPDDKLDWALTQVQNSLVKVGAP